MQFEYQNISTSNIAQSARAVEYTDSIFCRQVTPSQRVA